MKGKKKCGSSAVKRGRVKSGSGSAVSKRRDLVGGRGWGVSHHSEKLLGRTEKVGDSRGGRSRGLCLGGRGGKA